MMAANMGFAVGDGEGDGAAVGMPVGYEGYIDKRECAKRLGRTPRSVDTYMALGIIPYYKLGKTVAFKWSEVDASIMEHCRVGRKG